MPSAPDEFIPTRQSLISRLRNWDDQVSWKDFFNTYWRLIFSVARKAGLTQAEAEDVVQETVISVARRMPGFKYNPAGGSFKSWLMQITRRRIADHARKKQYQCGGHRYPREERLGTTLAEQYPDPAAIDLETIWNEEWAKHLFQAATAKVKNRVSSLQYQMFHLHVIKKVAAKSVAERLGVKLAEVYFAKYKISAQIKKEITLLENQLL